MNGVEIEMYRVLFHLDEEDVSRGKMVLGNIHNLLADLGAENVKVELVVNGSGVRLLVKNSPHQEQITTLAAQGVRIVACANSLKGANIHKDALLKPVEIVSAGVSELVRKQAEGWAYIRP